MWAQAVKGKQQQKEDEKLATMASSPSPQPPHTKGATPTTRQTVAAAVAAQKDLSIKERDQLRLYELQQRKLQRADKEREMVSFRHEQTVKRWEGGKQDVKPSKVLFLSDFVVAPSQSVDATQSSAPRKESVPLPKTRSRHEANPKQTDAVAQAPLPKSSVARALLIADEVVRQQQPHRPGTNHNVEPIIFAGRDAAMPAGGGAHLIAKVGDTYEGRHRGVRERRITDEKVEDEEVRKRLQRAAVPPPRTVSHSEITQSSTASTSVPPQQQAPLSSTKRRVFKQRAQAFKALHNEFALEAAAHRDPDPSSSFILMGSIVTQLETLYAQRHCPSREGGGDDPQQSSSKQSQKLLWKIRKAKSKLLQLQAAPSGVDNSPSPTAPGEVPAGPVEVERDDIDDEPQEMLTAELTGSLLHDDDDDGTQHISKDAASTTSPSILPAVPLIRRKRNFYPTLLQLGVGLHPLASKLDARGAAAVPCGEGPDVVMVASPQRPPQHGPTATQHLIREYCINVITNELDVAASSLLRRLQAAQKKLKSEQPMHFRARMRFQCGLREVIRSIIAKRVRLVLVAPDVEPVVNEGTTPAADAPHPLVAVPSIVAQTQTTRRGIEGTVRSIIDLCSEKSIPWACCLSRQTMGHALRLGRSHVSVVAILSADGAYEEYRSVITHLRSGLEAYQTLLVDRHEDPLKE